MNKIKDISSFVMLWGMILVMIAMTLVLFGFWIYSYWIIKWYYWPLTTVMGIILSSFFIFLYASMFEDITDPRPYYYPTYPDITRRKK